MVAEGRDAAARPESPGELAARLRERAAWEGEHSVTRPEVRRFACSISAMDPCHHDVAAARALGYPDLLAPAYFFVALGLTIGREVPRSALAEDGSPLDDELAGRRIMAGQTHVTWHGDILAGDRIVISQRLLSAEHRTGRTGPLDILTYERSYVRAGQLLVREEYVRLAR
jgi:hydroxyacyl-ACP dehydratase HTD2-like protein with hotdog domain